MLVFALRTRHRFGHFVNRLLKYVRDFGFASVRHEELRRDPATKHLVLAPQLTVKDAEAVEEDQGGLDPGFLFSLIRYQVVARDEQVVAGFEAIHVQTDDRPPRHQDGVQTVGHEVPDRLQPGESAAVLLAEADVAPDVGDGASGLLAANQPFLVAPLECQIRLAPDAHGAQTGQGWFRQSQAATSDELELLRSHG